MDTINLIHSILTSKSDINQNTQKEILRVLQTTLEQNYFHFDQHYCGIFAQGNNCEASRDSRCYGTALQTSPLLGNIRNTQE
jgi:hypothetical protein